MENSRKYILVGVTVTAALLISIVAWLLISQLSYGKEWADYDEMYRTDRGAAVFLDDSLASEYADSRFDQFYLTVDFVKAKLNDRFYVSDEGVLMYTLPEETVEVSPEQRQYTMEGKTTKTEWPVCFTQDGRLYVAVEFVALFTDMRYLSYREPERLLIYRGSRSEQPAQVTEEAQVRYVADRKSLILTEVHPGDEVCVLGAAEDWTKVRTADGFIGYMPAKGLVWKDARSVKNTFMQQEYTNISYDERICLAWHQVFVKDANRNLAEYLAATEGVTVISPTWFSLSDEEGGFTSLAEAWYVEEAHARGIEVWALIDDFDAEVDKFELLSRTASRRALITNLMAVADEYGLDGINIDFEKIDQDTGKHFVQFIRELSVECRKAGLVLSVDNYSLIGGRSWYDVKEQGVVADYVIMMGYDEHWAGGEPGSTASMGFTEKTIDLALEQVPAEKLIHGVPFYTRVWGVKAGEKVSSTAAGMLAAKASLEENNADIKWLDEEGQYFGQYLLDGIMYSIWLEDTKSMELKLDAVDRAGVAGVACWKLGLEDPEVWAVIEDYLD